MVLKIERPPIATQVTAVDAPEGVASVGGEGSCATTSSSRLEDPRRAKKQKRQRPRVAAGDNPIVVLGSGSSSSGGGGQTTTTPPSPPPPHPHPPPVPPPQDNNGRPAVRGGREEHRGPPQQPPPPPSTASYLRCAGCGVSDGAASGPLLLFEDPEDDNNHPNNGEGSKDEEEKRYCAGCMTGKKVRVFWPVDSQWYIADVQRYDVNTGEHLLRYPDGDTEWVRIGEDHTTNAQYKEYFSSLKNGQQNGGNGGDHHAHDHRPMTRSPSLLGNGVSFALSAAMSQSFGLPPHASYPEDERAHTNGVGAPPRQHDGRPHASQQQQRLFQQLDLDRTASSMSSFGMYGGRQPSFGAPPPPPLPPQPPQGGGGAGNGAGGGGGGRAPPFQILSPNFTHSFSSKIAAVPSLDFGPPPPHPARKPGSGGGTHPPSAYESYTHRHPPPPPPPPRPQQREEGNNGAGPEVASPGTRDGAPPPSLSNGGRGGLPSWPPDPRYAPPSSYYEAGAGPPHPPRPPLPPPQQQQQQRRAASYPYPSAAPSYEAQQQQPMPPHPPAPKQQQKQQQRQAPPSRVVPLSNGAKESAAKSRKALAKAWTKAEDEHLLDLVLEMKHPLKWSIIAQSLSDFSASLVDSDTPERTGKQCRERYVNHLNPRLKHAEFTPTEDATIWRLYATIGTQWAKMSKVIPGRTDNNLKNRFHNLKRQLHREEEGRSRAPPQEGHARIVHVDRVREVPREFRTRIEDMWNQPRHIEWVAADSCAADSREDDGAANGAANDGGNGDDGGGGECEQPSGEGRGTLSSTGRFGPFEAATVPTQCGRCGLFVPSVQCGTEVCAKTGWCRACTKVSMHLGGSVLRECLNLRKDSGGLTRGVADELLKEVWNAT